MQIKSAVFHTSARDLTAAPEWDRREFAMIGRSNVGKSSLVNMLTNSGDLAKVSASPGKTRLLNFFIINDSWSLVDLPGYGYAKVARSQKAEFMEAVADYLSQRPNLRQVFVLIDSRLPPQAIDLDFLQWLDQHKVAFSLVFTKADKQSLAKTARSVETFRTALPSHLHDVACAITSSKTGSGRGEVLRLISQTLDQDSV